MEIHNSRTLAAVHLADGSNALIRRPNRKKASS